VPPRRSRGPSPLSSAAQRPSECDWASGTRKTSPAPWPEPPFAAAAGIRSSRLPREHPHGSHARCVRWCGRPSSTTRLILAILGRLPCALQFVKAVIRFMSPEYSQGTTRLILAIVRDYRARSGLVKPLYGLCPRNIPNTPTTSEPARSPYSHTGISAPRHTYRHTSIHIRDTIRMIHVTHSAATIRSFRKSRIEQLTSRLIAGNAYPNQP